MNFNTKSAARMLIHNIARHSNWEPGLIASSLKERGVYADADEWKKFIYYALITLGLSFLVAGVIFFFAFNWANLHKFAKLGIIQTLLIVFTLSAIFIKTGSIIKNILLMAAAVSVGALFAVFGQIYQTGANAYDFFLGWTVFVVVWALVSGFAPLWLLLVGLINLTFNLYTEQVSTSFDSEAVYTVLFAFNSLVIVLSEWLFAVNKLKSIPKWFTRCVALAAIVCATIGISIGIHDNFMPWGFTSLMLAFSLYYLAIRRSLIQKDIFYLCAIPLSVQVCLASLLARISYDPGMFFVIAFLFLGGVTFQISQIISLNKKWYGEQ